MATGSLTLRLSELLDAVKSELDSLTQEIGNVQLHQDEYENKINAQVQEMQSIRQALFDLELTHKKIIKQYEEEIQRFRLEIDSRGNPQTASTAVNVSTRGPALVKTDLMPQQHLTPVFSRSPQSQQPPISGPSKPNPHPFPGLSRPLNVANPQGAQAAVSRPTSSDNVSRSNSEMRARETKPSSLKGTSFSSSNQKGAKSVTTVPVQGLPAMELHPDAGVNELKKEASDWHVIYNPQNKTRQLNVKLLHSFDHTSVVCCVRFSVDGKYLATGCNLSAQIFDVLTGERLCILQDESVNRDGDLYIRSVCFSPDGNFLANGAEDGVIRVSILQSTNAFSSFAPTRLTHC